MIFFFKQKTAYEIRISDWSSDVCSSDLTAPTAYIDGVYRFVDGSSWKLSFGSSAYTVAMPEDAHLGLLFDGAGGVKFAVNGQWVNPDSGSLVSDPNAISFSDITGGGHGDTFLRADDSRVGKECVSKYS